MSEVKAIVFDADGMVIQGERFSSRFSRDFKVPIESLNEYFNNEFKDCILGKADLIESLSRYFPKWGYHGTISELLEYWFGNSYHVEPEMIQAIQELKEKGVICILATNQEKYRLSYMKDNMGLGNIFNHIIASSEIGFKKKDLEFLTEILGRIPHINKGDILFFDDREENIEAARKFGFRAKTYESIAEFREVVGLSS